MAYSRESDAGNPKANRIPIKVGHTADGLIVLDFGETVDRLDLSLSTATQFANAILDVVNRMKLKALPSQN